MEKNSTPAGKVLDERYEIRRVLEADTDAILYEGWHIRVEKKVLIQEIDLGKDDVEEILSRARQLGDFSDMPGLCHVSDQFEEKDKAYIIYDYPEGISLEEYFSGKKRLSEDELADMFLPILRNLDKLQNAGVRDMTVSMKSLYRSENGTLCLVPEIMDYGMTDGDYPYAVSEIFYECLSGKKPPKKLVRMLLDETEPLEKCDPKGDAQFHRIVKKGMSTDPDEGFHTPEEMYQEIEIWKQSRKSHKGNVFYLAAGWALLGILTVGILFGVYKKFEEKIRFLGVETETVMLTPSEDMKRKDYISSIDVIKNRVKKLTGDNKYWIEDENGKIRVVLPWKVYEENEDNGELEAYLTEPLKIQISVLSRDKDSGDIQWNVQKAGVELSPYCIVNIKEMDVTEEEKDKVRMISEYMAYNITKKLEITVSDEVAQGMKESLEPELQSTAGEERELYSSLAGINSVYNTEVKDDDWHKIYIYESSFFEKIAPILMDETLKADFEMSEEIPADWKERSSDVFENWVGEDEIEEPSVKLEYNSYVTEMDDGDYYHNIGDLAGRLESLGISYAIGTGKNDRNVFVVKVQQKDMSDFVAAVLCTEGGSGEVAVYDRWGNALYMNDCQIRSESGKWIIEFTGSEKNMNEFMEPVLKDNGNIYLRIKYNYNVAELHLEEIPDGTDIDGYYRRYEFVFEDCLLGTSGKFTEEMDPLADFFGLLWQDGNMNTSFSLSRKQYISKDFLVGEKEEEKDAWEPGYTDVEKLQENIKEIDSNVKVSVADSFRDTLYISLGMDTDLDYTEKAMEKIKEIWDKCELDKGNYSIYFYIKKSGSGPMVYMDKNKERRKWLITAEDYSRNTYAEKLQELVVKALDNKDFGENAELDKRK
mgnify:FL=1